MIRLTIHETDRVVQYTLPTNDPNRAIELVAQERAKDRAESENRR